MQFDLVIAGGTVVTGDATLPADVGICNGKIAALGNLAHVDSYERLDAKGLHVLPGIIDSHVHFREPGLTHKEDLESGTRGAILGGVTTIFEMPNTQPPTTTAEELQEKLIAAKGRAWCDHAFYIGAAHENCDQLEVLEDLPGTPGIKVFMGSSTGSLLIDDDETLRRVFRNGRRRCCLHAEDESRLQERKGLIGDAPDATEHPFLRDAETARLATERAIGVSRETGRPIHILHVTTSDELPLILHAKQEGLDTSCEVTPQHLTLHAPECYEVLKNLAQQNPPIRGKEHQMALWTALRHGLIDTIGSDHAPHLLEEKGQPYPKAPSGMPGVQTMLPVMLGWSHLGDISLPKLVRLMCENPARLFGVKGKGFIRTGFDADFAVVDLEKKWTITTDWLQSKCGWSPFLGTVITGKPIHTVLRGQVVVADGELVGKPSGKAVEFDWKKNV